MAQGLRGPLSTLISHRKAPAVLVGVLMLVGVAVSTAFAAPVQLLLPQSTAFAILGHSCGGIQEKAYATDFDPLSKYPMGDVYIQTRCGASGRGGGYHVTTYSAWVAATWDFAGVTLSSAKLASAPLVNPTFSATDAYGDTLYNLNYVAYLSVPVPSAPANVMAVQSGDQFRVSWTPSGANPIAITSSILTAAPVASTASVLTAMVSGSATTGSIGPLQPQTTYQVTVVNTTIGGSSPASTPISRTTTAASVAPSAPSGVMARWTAVGATTAALVATWNAANPGDSPIDEYEVLIVASDGGGTFTQTESGATLMASFVVDFIPDWGVQVRAHNAAGWGPWSASYTLGGL